jgi:hypothetical protein
MLQYLEEAAEINVRVNAMTVPLEPRQPFTENDLVRVRLFGPKEFLFRDLSVATGDKLLDDRSRWSSDWCCNLD